MEAPRKRVFSCPLVLLLFLVLGTASAKQQFHTLSVQSKTLVTNVMHSSVVRDLVAKGNHSFPTGGSVWPTAIYWTTIEVGTPPQKFPVAIDSGSSDLLIEGLNCNGCNKKAPNSAYDSTASSTSSSAFPSTFSNTVFFVLYFPPAYLTLLLPS